MSTNPDSVELMIEAALQARDAPSRQAMIEALDALPAPVYLTDADGRVTHFNTACIEFAGRVPQVGKDQWCVSWRLYTDEGEPLAHDQCPMANALREGRAVRGIEAMAERPDGSRVRFLPFATPLFDEDGALAGGVNLLLDITDRHRAGELREQAARCRRLAVSVLDRRTIEALNSMASEYESEAARLDRRN